MSIEIKMSIPLDSDGFVEMQCDYCENRFMLHESVYSAEANLHFFCPICGLPNSVSTFFCPEVLEAAQRKVINYAYDKLQRELGSVVKEINKSGFITVNIKGKTKEPEKELFLTANEYVLVHQKCCNIDIKATEFDKNIGLYCPICGGEKL